MGKIIFGKYGKVKAREDRNGNWIVYDDNFFGGSKEKKSSQQSCNGRSESYWEGYNSVKRGHSSSGGSLQNLWIAVVGTLLGVFATIGLFTIIWCLICLL